MSEVLGKFCSVAKYNQVIMPKSFPGYKTPEGQTLVEDGQKIVFKYVPIDYNITYKLEGGSFPEGTEVANTYTVRTPDYYPPEPVMEDHSFTGWKPLMIPKGTIGDFSFKATWKVNSHLITGQMLHDAFTKIGETAGVEDFSIDNIVSIRRGYEIPDSKVANPVNLSYTDTPVWMWWSPSNNSIYFYCEDDNIYCDKDMAGAFQDMTCLVDIKDLSYWVCPEDANIDNLFNGCRMLADTSSIDNWGNGKFASFDKAFYNTIALDAGRVPSWYRIYATIEYMSWSDKKIAPSMSGYFIPDQYVYAKTVTAYTADEESIQINKPNETYTFMYTPIEYSIEYNTAGGILEGAKESYTTEDSDYYPPEPVKEGFTFTGWIPKYIASGTYGNVSFVATYN